MTRYAGLLALQLRISVGSAIAYRANFAIKGAMSIVWIALTLLPLIVLFDGRASVAGWDAPSALIVVGYFMGVRAVLEGVITPSLVDLIEKIRSGSFDYVLLKPVDAQIMISASRYEPWKVFDMAGAVAVVVYAFLSRGTPPSPANVVLGAVLFGTGVIATYALWIMCAAASFWVVRFENVMYLLGALYDAARWPVHVFPGAWRFVFTFVLPIAAITTYPAMALLGKLDTSTALATMGGSLLLLAVSRAVWRIAIRSYTSASS
jgi:ABC-2 type transport system permease protein